MRSFRFLLLAAVPIVFSLQPAALRADDRTDVQALQQRIKQLEARVAELEARVGRPTTRPVSQLGPIAKGDLLHLCIEDLAGPGVQTLRETRVGEDGRAGLPMVGPLRLAGMTLPDAERAVVAEFRAQNLIANAVVKLERWETGTAPGTPTGPLRTGDFVRVWVVDLRGPGLETIVNTQVDGQGRIDLPYLHEVQVAGQSEADAAKTIDKAYRDANLIQNGMAAVLRTGSMEGL
jgi:protein involved in polysaccharide export with SLBB domain